MALIPLADSSASYLRSSIWCFLNRNRRSLWNHIFQLLQYLFIVDNRNLPIGQRYLAHIIAAKRRLRFQCLQISCNQQKAVHRWRIIPNLGINHSCVDVCQNWLSLQQFIEMLINVRICIRQDLADNFIIARRLSESLGPAMISEIVYDWPRIKYFRAAEPVSVIPCTNLLVFLLCTVIAGNFFYFLRCKPKIFAVPAV